jgi:hypothetical protein
MLDRYASPLLRLLYKVRAFGSDGQRQRLRLKGTVSESSHADQYGADDPLTVLTELCSRILCCSYLHLLGLRFEEH